MWHFTDFAYHTSLDRLSHVDPRVVRRMSVALVTAAMAVADPEPGDLERYRQTIALERQLRSRAASGDKELVSLWNEWCDETLDWFEVLCRAKSQDTGH